MKIKLWPDLVSWSVEASVSGDVITINGEKFDFSPLKSGFRLPASAIGSNYFVTGEFIERIDGIINITLLFPVDWRSPEEIRNPLTPIYLDVVDGAVPFPDASPQGESELLIVPSNEEV